MRDLKKGDRVMVYEDPVTKKRPEGSAVVVKVLRQTLDDLGAYVTIRFDPEKLGYEGERFDRTVIEDAVCVCSSNDLDRTPCPVHGKAA